MSQELMLLTAKILISKMVKIVADCSVKVQEAFDALVAEGGKIEVFPKRTRTVELDNGTYQATRQSYKFYVPEELMEETKRVLHRLREEGKARKAQGIDHLNAQVRFTHNGTKFICLDADNWFEKGPAIIFTLDNSEIASSRAVGMNAFEDVVAKDKEAQHFKQLTEELTADDLAKIEKSKAKVKVDTESGEITDW